MVLRLYDFLKERPTLRWLSLLAISITLVLLIFKISYKEDISDFLPLGTNDRDALSVYQDISGTGRVFVLFENPQDEDLTVSAINRFTEIFEEKDSLHWINDLTAQFDLESITEIGDFVYNNIPYFLTEKDYQRIESQINSSEDFVESELKKDHESLLFPSGGMVAENISRDPLNLFSPVLNKLQSSNENLSYEMYDGKIFTPDMRYAVVMMTSPFGASETEHNSMLMELISDAISDMQIDYPEIKVHAAGGPEIAVENSTQVKKDSAISVTLAVILILSLLIYSFRSKRNMVMIIVSILWGWIFALGMLSLINDSISIIVVGISSVILGIAVNYPLHLVDHLKHEPNIRNVLKDIVVPLVVGNVTTVGAFMALVPLNSIALRDLGLFASLLLVGTILFVLIYLPHVVKSNVKERESKFFTRLSNLRLENNRTVVWIIFILTIIFGWYSFDTSFDSNIANINYMNPRTKADMEYFQSLLSFDTTSGTKTLYVVSSDTTFDAALQKSERRQSLFDSLVNTDDVVAHEGVTNFICSSSEQQSRINRWNRFVNEYGNYLTDQINAKASIAGFKPEAFEQFFEILRGSYEVQPYEFYKPLTKLVFSDNLSDDYQTGRCSVVDKLQVNESEVSKLRKIVPDSFDVDNMNRALADSLSDNFNYIGWACSFIVFFFLWFSFGNLELAALSFLPMAISWLWILGIMTILNIKFNIVNVILATFIFGQGDDYTIFMTEGCCYEHAYRRPLLSSYKNSIILSAFIMFVGIGSLIIAKHPALKSLAEVTIIGMFSVVLMAYVLPALIYKWLTSKNGHIRIRPLKFTSLLRTVVGGIWWFIQLGVGYLLAFILYPLGKRYLWAQRILHSFVTSCYRFDLKYLPNVKVHHENPYNEDFTKPSIVVSNHQSILDPMCLMAINPRILIITSQKTKSNPIVKKMFKYLDFYTLTDSFKDDMDIFKQYIERGYSFAIFPEGFRNPHSTIERFHKGAFYMAHALGIDIVPVFIHGLNSLMPIHNFACEKGEITIKVEKRIKTAELPWGDNARETTKYVHKLYVQKYEEIRSRVETVDYHKAYVKDRYLYKGIEVYRAVSKNIKRYDNYRKWIENIENVKRRVVIVNNGLGEFALMLSVVHPELRITAYEKDEMNRSLAKYSAEDVTTHIDIKPYEEIQQEVFDNDMLIYVINPTESERIKYKDFQYCSFIE